MEMRDTTAKGRQGLKGTAFAAVLWLGIVGTALVTAGCGSSKKTLLARTYQNFHAFFNGYYNANRLYKENTRGADVGYLPPADGFLPLIDGKPEGDPALAAEVERDPKALDKVIEKCEYMIYRRKNSDWVDDARLLIGKALYLKGEYVRAQQNFEYIPAAFPKSELVPVALLWQAKVQYQQGELGRARALLDQSLKLPASDRLARAESAMLLANLLVAEGQYSQATKVLDDNLKVIKGKKERTRVHFLLGQLYDHQKLYYKAVEHYRKVISLDYSDALVFRAEMALLGIKLKAPGSVKGLKGNVEEKLRAMAESERYAPFADHILYELGMAYVRTKRVTQAERAFKDATQKGQPRSLHRTLAYYQLGLIAYGEKKQLRRASTYFDSAAVGAKPEYKDYRDIQAKAQALRAFAVYSDAATRLDSLLVLAQLPEREQDARINEALEQEDEQAAAAEALKAAEEERQRQAALVAANRQRNTDGGPNVGTFYFDQPELVAQGKTTFQKTWGTRPNADNWRWRAQLAQGAGAGVAGATTATAEAPAQGGTSRTERRQRKRMEIPSTPEARAKAEGEWVDAMLGLADVYNDRLNLPTKAEETLRQLLERHRTGLYAQKGHYALYRLLKTSNPSLAQAERELILREYPASDFARLIRNEGKPANERVEANDFETGYDAMFGLYNSGEYGTMRTLAQYLQENFPTHPDMPKLVYLKAMSWGQQGNRDSLRAGLEYLARTYPSAPITAVGNKTLRLLAGLPYDETSTGTTAAGTPGQRPPRPADIPAEAGNIDYNYTQPFVRDRKPGEGVVVLLFFDQKAGAPTVLTRSVTQFNAASFAGKKLETNVYSLPERHLVYVTQFADWKEAKAYLEAVGKSPFLSKMLPKPEEQMVMISPTNFRIAFTGRRFEEYLRFYKTNVAAWLSN